MPEQREHPGSGRRILVVDDERAIRDLLETMLRRRHFEVVGALAPAAALPWIADESHEVDLLITDVSMPDIDGTELAEQLRSRKPDLPVIFISGYSDLETARKTASGPRDRFLAKPFKLNDLFTAIEALIGPS
jgi:two-component system, cell cycle sensor histidine kinase and response regulator CckA